MTEKRYFFYSASYQKPKWSGSENGGLIKNDGKFPTMGELKDVIQEHNPTAKRESIVVTGITELSLLDFQRLFSKSNKENEKIQR